MPRPRAHRPQDRHLAAALVKAGEDRREHADQTGQHHEQRDHKQGFFGSAHHAPQFLQRHAGQDRQHRLATEFIDLPLQGKGGNLVVQAEHERGDGLRRQVHIARLVGTDAAFALGRHAVVPVDMNRFHAAEADMQRAVHRRAGALENADHRERLVVVLDQADHRHAVGQHQLVAEFVMQGVGHFGAEHYLEWVGGEGAAAGQLEVLLAPVLVVLEVGLVGAHHPVAAMGVAEGNRDRPFHLWAGGEVLVAVPTDVVGGVADAEHRIQQQVDRAGTGADDQVGAADGAGETVARLYAHTLHREQQADGQCDGKRGEDRGKAAVSQAGHG